MGKQSDEVARSLETELDSLWRFAWRLTRHEDDAVDLVQKTCLRALECADQYDSRGRMRSWLMRISHRIWLNELRSRQIRKGKSFNSLETGNEEQEQLAAVDGQGFIEPESNLLLHQVHAVVEALPEAQRLVVLLVCVEGMAYKEAADVLDLPIGTVMSRLSRARAAIGAKILKSDGNESNGNHLSGSLG